MIQPKDAQQFSTENRVGTVAPGCAGPAPYLLLALLALLRALLAGRVGGGGGGGRLLLEQAGGIDAPGRNSIVLVRDHGRA